MYLITKFFIEHGERHPSYKRELKKAIDLEARKKDPNKKEKKRENVKFQEKRNLLVSNVSTSPERIIYIQSC
jgi:hypothetical protein